MTPRSAYQLQILEKIGAPLLAAAEAAQPDAQRAEAAVVAELLACSVRSGLTLAQVMDVKEQGADGEAVRLALSALAASLVAGLYRHTAQAPGDTDMQRQVTALSAVLTFADNYAPAAGNTARLAALEAGTPPVDETQVMIQCLYALIPVVIVIAGYSFGRPEKKMVQEVTERLARQTGLMAERLLPQVAPADRKLAELSFLRAMAPLYCEAHRTETARVMALSDAARQQAAQGGVLPLDPLWEEFDRHVALLDVLGQSLLGKMMAASQGGATAPAPQSPPVQVQPPVTPQVFKNPAPAQTTAPAAPPAENASYNPMAFFKPGQTKSDDSNNT